MNNHESHPKPPPIQQTNDGSQKAGCWLIGGTILAIIFNAVVQAVSALIKIGGLSEASSSSGKAGLVVGMIVGSVVVYPVIVVGLFAIGKSFRNVRSCLKVLAVTSLIFGLLGVMQLFKIVAAVTAT